MLPLMPTAFFQARQCGSLPLFVALLCGFARERRTELRGVELPLRWRAAPRAAAPSPLAVVAACRGRVAPFSPGLVNVVQVVALSLLTAREDIPSTPSSPRRAWHEARNEVSRVDRLLGCCVALSQQHLGTAVQCVRLVKRTMRGLAEKTLSEDARMCWMLQNHARTHCSLLVLSRSHRATSASTTGTKRPIEGVAGFRICDVMPALPYIALPPL